MHNGKIVYWKMSNGHEHSFYTEEDDWTQETNVPETGWDGTSLKTQGDYCDFVEESENTTVEDEQIFAWSDPKDIEPEVWEENWEHVFDLLDHL
jgi:hypothetical protein